jgi:hypothetical protein
LKGVDELWQHEGNVLRIGPHDFSEESRERNWSIYNMRVVEKRTLSFIAEKYGLSRERIRQIVFKGERVMLVPEDGCAAKTKRRQACRWVRCCCLLVPRMF